MLVVVAKDMSKTLMKTASFYLTDNEMAMLDKMRGPIPRSTIGVIAVHRLIKDVKARRLNLLKEEARMRGRGQVKQQ